MEWEVDVDGKFDKEVCVYSLNTVILAFSSAYNVSRWKEADLWGLDRYHDQNLGNPATQQVSSPANTVYSAAEPSPRLSNSRAKAIFAAVPLFPNALSATTKAKIPSTKIFILIVPGHE
jgi:hypothetical protein